MSERRTSSETVVSLHEKLSSAFKDKQSGLPSGWVMFLQIDAEPGSTVHPAMGPRVFEVLRGHAPAVSADAGTILLTCSSFRPLSSSDPDTRCVVVGP